MKQRNQLLAVAVALSALAIFWQGLFGRVEVPQLEGEPTLWVSRADQEVLYQLTDEEARQLGEILSRQTLREDPERYEDLVLRFFAFQNGKEALQPTLCRLTDGTNEFVMKYPDGSCYGLDTRSVLQLLTSGTLDSLFDYIEEAPTLTVTEGEQFLTVHCTENGWQYKKIDNSVFMDGVLVKDKETLFAPVDYRGIGLQFSTPPGGCWVRIYRAGEEEAIFEGGPAVLDEFDPALSGQYQMKVFAHWTETASQRYSGRCVYTVDLQVTKEAEAAFSADRLSRGELLTVTVTNPEDPDSLRANVGWGTVSGFTQVAEGRWACLVAAQTAGSGSVHLVGSGFSADHPVIVSGVRGSVLPGVPFPEEEEEEETYYFYNDADEQEEEADHPALETIRGQTLRTTRDRYWRGAFGFPTTAAAQVDFGGRFESASPLLDGTFWWQPQEGASASPRAVNMGVVAFVGRTKETGLTVAIDHGLGLFSWYYGLDETTLTENAPILTGDVVGTVQNPDDGEPRWYGVQTTLSGGAVDGARIWGRTLLEEE